MYKKYILKIYNFLYYEESKKQTNNNLQGLLLKTRPRVLNLFEPLGGLEILRMGCRRHHKMAAMADGANHKMVARGNQCVGLFHALSEWVLAADLWRCFF